MTSLLIYALKQSTQHLSHCWGSRHVRNNVQYYNSAASLFSYQFLFFSSIEFIKVIPVLNSKSICGLHFQSKWAKQGNIVPLFFLFLSTVEHPSPAQQLAHFTEALLTHSNTVQPVLTQEGLLQIALQGCFHLIHVLKLQSRGRTPNM